MIFRQIFSRAIKSRHEARVGFRSCLQSRFLADEANDVDVKEPGFFNQLLDSSLDATPAEIPVTTVKQLLDSAVDDAGLEATARGWISGVRSQKENTFVDIVDGSSFRHLQVVFKSDFVDPDSIVYGSAVRVSGRLQPSNHPMQKVELIGRDVQVIGTNDPAEFPIKAKVHKTHDGDYLRNEALTHRHRTHAGGSMLKIRNRATMAYHEFFQNRGFLLVNTPILTSNDCEGAGEVFRVVAKGDDDVDEDGKTESYFKRDVHLTVSGQLHLEAFAQGLSKVYTFGPTFRADSTTSRFHLSEFYMVEAEVAFVDTISVRRRENREGLKIIFKSML